jgi:hypothetical protein
MPERRGCERVEIILEAQPSGVPAWCRIRGLLKAALRSWGLRCLSVRDMTPQLPPLSVERNAGTQESGCDP